MIDIISWQTINFNSITTCNVLHNCMEHSVVIMKGLSCKVETNLQIIKTFLSFMMIYVWNTFCFLDPKTDLIFFSQRYLLLLTTHCSSRCRDLFSRWLKYKYFISIFSRKISWKIIRISSDFSTISICSYIHININQHIVG